MSGTLYAALGGAQATSHLYTVDPLTGAMTTGANMSVALTGLAWDPVGQKMYAITSNNSAGGGMKLYTVDLTTGTTNFVGAVSVTNVLTISDIAFDASGQLYGWIGNYSNNLGYGLMSINKSTAAGTIIHTQTGQFADATSPGPGAISFAGGTLYFFGDPNLALESINTSTGIATHVANFSGTHPAGTFTATAYDGTTLYGIVRGNAGIKSLYTVGLSSGAMALIGSSGGLNSDSDALEVKGAEPPISRYAVELTHQG